ncbi:MAG: tail fiber protein [bacterium]|nr:tail fiber protein [bacterium]
MRRFINLGLVCFLFGFTLAFAGCEEGLRNNSNSEEKTEEGSLEDLEDNFSFSAIDKNIKILKQEILNLRAALKNQGTQVTGDMEALHETISGERGEDLRPINDLLAGLIRTDANTITFNGVNLVLNRGSAATAVTFNNMALGFNSGSAAFSNAAVSYTNGSVAFNNGNIDFSGGAVDFSGNALTYTNGSASFNNVNTNFNKGTGTPAVNFNDVAVNIKKGAVTADMTGHEGRVGYFEDLFKDVTRATGTDLITFTGVDIYMDTLDMDTRVTDMYSTVDDLDTTFGSVSLDGSTKTLTFKNLSLEVEDSTGATVVANLADGILDNVSSISDLSNTVDTKFLESAPPGTIVPFAGVVTEDDAPDGWELCDGRSLERTGKYEKLWEAISTAWGSVDDENFNLPDLRGVFLRGVDNGTGRDPNANNRYSRWFFDKFGPYSYSYQLDNAGGYIGNPDDAVGSYQGDAFQGHYHKHKNTSDGLDDPVVVVYKDGAGPGLRSEGANETTAGFQVTDPESDGTNGVPRTAKETRPVNAYVNYIIKY